MGAVSRFRYGADPLCLASCALYATNRWVWKPHTMMVFLHSHFNDLLLIPCALPLALWIHRRLGWRADDRPPELGEIALHLMVWSLAAEVLAPQFCHATADPLDVLTYAVGALLAWVCWRSLAAQSATAPRLALPAVFLITALVRTAQGSATVAMITSAPIAKAFIDGGGTHIAPVYFAIAIDCGSKPFPWMNDGGFWIISRLSGLREDQTLRTEFLGGLIGDRHATTITGYRRNIQSR